MNQTKSSAKGSRSAEAVKMTKQQAQEAVYPRPNGLKSRVQKRKMHWVDYAKVACRQICDNAERQNRPRPIISFVLDDDSVEHGPFLFPTIPKKGEFIEPEWLRQKDEAFSAYEIIGVMHCVPNDFCCEVPHLMLWVTRTDYFARIHS